MIFEATPLHGALVAHLERKEDERGFFARVWCEEEAAAHGIDPALLHRIAVISAGTLDSLPHNGAVVTLLAVCGVTHRDSYKDIFVVAIVGALLALAAVIVLGSIFGSF